MAARWNFRCPSCGYRWENYAGARPLTDETLNPDCPRHEYESPIRMVWVPDMPGVSAYADSDAQGPNAFSKFTIPVEDPGSPTGFRDETIGSLADIRRLERESEQRERDGLGRRMIWRDFSQDRSNRDVHTMGPDPSLRPAKHYSNGTPVKVRRGDPVVADHGEQHLGPKQGPDTLQGAGR